MRKNDQRIRLTKMLIRRAFLDLLRTKPMQGISIKELCTAAGINREPSIPTMRISMICWSRLKTI